MTSVVYAIVNKDTGHVKFGRSADVSKRLRDLQQNTGCTLELAGAVSEDLAMRFGCEEAFVDGYLESLIHQICSGARIRGEWFAPTELVMNLVDAFKNDPLAVGVLADYFSANPALVNPMRVENEMAALAQRAKALEVKVEALSDELAASSESYAHLHRQDIQRLRCIRRIKAALEDHDDSIEKMRTE